MEFRNLSELARYFGVNRSSTCRWLQRGLPHSQLGGYVKSFDLEEVLKWLLRESPRHASRCNKLLARLEENEQRAREKTRNSGGGD